MKEERMSYAKGDQTIVRFRCLSRVMYLRVDAEAVMSGACAVGHGAGTRQKFENRWSTDTYLGLVERYWLGR